MKKTILVLLIFVSLLGKSQCHTYDTANVQKPILGEITSDSMTVTITFSVIEQGSPFTYNQLLCNRAVTFKISSTQPIYPDGALAADTYVYNWVQNNYKPW